MPKKGLKVGKDVLNKKSSGILTVKEREGFEKWKAQKLAEDLAKQEKEQELHGKKIVSKMIEDRAPRPEGLTPEEFAEMKRLAKLKKKAQTE